MHYDSDLENIATTSNPGFFSHGRALADLANDTQTMAGRSAYAALSGVGLSATSGDQLPSWWPERDDVYVIVCYVH